MKIVISDTGGMELRVDDDKCYEMDFNSGMISQVSGGSGYKLNRKPPETKEEKVVRCLKGDFEKLIGMSFDEFCEIRNKIIEEQPEKLI